MNQPERQYRFRTGENSTDANKLNQLFTDVFHPEKVGDLAETLFRFFPGLPEKNWFITEDINTGKIVSAFVLIPWVWEFCGTRLKVAEMGIVGTLEEYRRKGLFARLSNEFDKQLDKQEYDLAVIQGIPGFYQKFDYQYSVPLECFINIKLEDIHPGYPEEFAFRKAEITDIPFLMAQDKKYRDGHDLSVVRNKAVWEYLLTHSVNTEYGSEYWIFRDQTKTHRGYFRIPFDGFGEGLIVSEISEDITQNSFQEVLKFCKSLAIKREKPSLRINLNPESGPGKLALENGAEFTSEYAWQIKFPDLKRFLLKIKSILESRIKSSPYTEFSGTFRINHYTGKVVLTWVNGLITSVDEEADKPDHAFAINPKYLPALLLGHRTWREIRYISPDLFTGKPETAAFMDILFPAQKLWIHEQY